MFILSYAVTKIKPSRKCSGCDFVVKIIPEYSPLGKPVKIVVIVGPTASGKSDLAIQLAQKISFKGGSASGWSGAEIISADSRQVYRGMDIGTGKVSKKEQKITPHHLIDIASPKKQFTASHFKKLGQKAITEIQCRYKIPIIVGGAGFYIDVLLGRISIAAVPPNKKLRAQFDKLTVEHLFKMLQKLDPERARTIEPKNKRRLIRALEIAMSSKSPQQPPKPSKLTSKNAAAQFVVSSKNTLWIGLRPANLKQRIKKRLDERLKQGAVKEVINLRKQGLSWKRLDNFGLEYRWIARYLQNPKLKTLNSKQIKNSKLQIPNFKKSEYYEKLLREIVKYSKRQMTWFRRNKQIHWIKNKKETFLLIKKFLN